MLGTQVAKFEQHGTCGENVAKLFSAKLLSWVVRSNLDERKNEY